jgi:NodT family efflux transporter outer membrane factor (OMF) lipoprotein
MKPSGFPPRALAAGMSFCLAACAVGPNYHQPAAPAVAGYLPSGSPTATPQANAVAAGGTQTLAMGADISGQWWALFQSPELNALIDTALANNPTLAAAQQTLIEAEENLRAEQGAFSPSLSASFQDERQRISSAQSASFGAGSSVAGSNAIISPFTIYDTSINLSYTPDVFGGVRRQVENLAAQAEYQRYELEASYLSLTTNIVTAAVTEASYNAQIAATQQVISVEQHQFNILNNQFTLGGVPKADVLNEQATLANTLATLPPLQSGLAQARNQLAAYVGALPANFDENDFTLQSLHLPMALPVSLPSALVEQRPDIAAAAAQLHAATANLGIATANMLPQITLSAAVGREALTTGTLFTPQTLVWSLIAGITQPLFEGGTLSARRKAALAATRAASDQYQATVISAFQNVADVLQALQFDAQTLNAAQAAVDAAQQSLVVTQNQFKLGGQPLTAVLTAQTTYQNAVLTQAKAAATRLADTAGLFQALGGGWWHRADVDPAAQKCCGLIP